MNRSRLFFFIAVVFLVVVIMTGIFLMLLPLGPKNLTPTVTVTIASPTFTPVPIKTGPKEISDSNVSALQRQVESGTQLFLTDPLQVVREDGKKYGFSAEDNFVLLQNYFDSASQEFFAEVRVSHEAANFLVMLKQPGTQGAGGVWQIFEIKAE